MARKKEYIRWAIYGECGLYVGQRQTMKDAIAEHVAAKYGVSPYVVRELDESQREAWNICKKNGDRAVRIRITLMEDA